ncbi:hypothetical protein [Flexivirga endophytica]|uniref:hypothetical protein n=1 Tax=Flexivirga endophytica TaxID=1849103 RepID=UPI0016654BCF|nr:hypothetical protein [Flexivirga endophytica]
MRPVTRISICALTIALSPAVVACGSGDAVTVTNPSSNVSGPSAASVDTNAPVPDAKKLADDARSAYRSAKSAHVHATIDDGTGMQTIDIHGTMDGTNQELSVKDPVGGDATLRTVDDKYYIKGNQDFWENAVKSNSTTAALLADKWVLAPEKSTTRSSVSKLTIRAVLDEMLGDGALSDSELAEMKTSRASDNGTALFVATDEGNSGDVNTFKVLADGSNNVAEVSGKSDDGSDGTAKFDGWDTQKHVDVPKGYVTFPGPTSGPGGGTGPGRDT